MKHIYSALLIFLFAVSCKKEIQNDTGRSIYLENVKAQLRDSLAPKDFTLLDFNRAFLSKSEKLWFLRIPFTQKNVSNDFVIVKTDKNGTVERGKIVHLEGNVRGGGFDGSISISSLDRRQDLKSPVSNGYIKAFHSANNGRVTVYAEDVLQEVVVVAYISNGNDYSTWLWLNSLFYNSDYGEGGGSGYGYYGSMDGGGGGYYPGGGGSYGSGGGGSVAQEELLELEAEYIYDAAEIDVWKYFNCFDQVPSPGATYSIKMYVDIPSNNNPGASSTSSGSSAGHTFLSITKANGASKVTQSFGFYPTTAPSFLDPFSSVSSSIKDNGGHEYNAAIEMNISEGQFNTIRNTAISRSTLSYNLGSYNCTNYALDVFNTVRITPIRLDPYKLVLPGDNNPYGPSQPNTVEIEDSPQMLFIKLQEMQSNNSPDAPKIVVDQTHNSLSPVSHGECN